METYGEAEAETVRDQAERVLSLDVDGSGSPGVRQGDPAVGALRERYPGPRLVCFYSPYEAAAWAIIGDRVRISHAARVKARMAEDLGDPVGIRGRDEQTFPGPSRLLELDGFPGPSGRKVEYLRALVRATLEGKLEAPYLRSMAFAQAIAGLEELPGIGDFSAELILLRGAGLPGRSPWPAAWRRHPPQVKSPGSPNGGAPTVPGWPCT